VILSDNNTKPPFKRGLFYFLVNKTAKPHVFVEQTIPLYAFLHYRLQRQRGVMGIMLRRTALALIA
jgi:hypothetical protein